MSYFNVGDKGQRYEVRYIEVSSGLDKTYGWTQEADGGVLLASAKLNPSARDPYVVDRHAAQGRQQSLLGEDEMIPFDRDANYPDFE